MNNIQTMMRARKFGVASLILFFAYLAWFIPGIVLTDLGYSDVVTVVFCLIVPALTVAYVIFLRGVLALAHEVNDQKFIRNAKWAMIINGLFGAIIFFGMAPPPFGLPTNISHIVIVLGCFSVGIVTIMLADNFKKLQPSFGSVALYSEVWSKVAGVCIFSFYFLFLGLALLVIAQIYVLKLLGAYIKKQKQI